MTTAPYSWDNKTMPKQRPEKLAKIKVSLPASLLAQVDIHFFDPVTGKPRYGARSALIERLLRKWVREQKRGN